MKRWMRSGCGRCLLIEAMKSPTGMERWLGQKTPGIFRGLAPDEWVIERTSWAATGKLSEMLSEEREKGGKDSVAQEVWPAVLQLMQREPKRVPQMCSLLKQMDLLKREAQVELRKWWRDVPKTGAGARQWTIMRWGKEVTLLLASSGNCELAEDFLVVLNSTNTAFVRAIAAEAVGELGCREERVIEGLRKVLNAPAAMGQGGADFELVQSSLRACVMLGVCPPEARKYLNDPFMNANIPGWQNLTRFLGWLNDPKDEMAAKLLAVEFGRSSPLHVRLESLKLLGRAGPMAEQFVPALREMLEEPIPAVREAAARALEEIEGTESAAGMKGE